MTSKTHNAAAFAALITAAAYSQAESTTAATVVVGLIFNIIGSLLPDIDQASNRLWDLLPGGNLVGKVMKRIFWGHRSLSHSLLGLFLVYWGLKSLFFKMFNPEFIEPELVLTALMLGYGSHLAADSLTEEGLPLLWPIRHKFGLPPIKKWRIKTDGWFEKFVIFPGIVIYSLWTVLTNWQAIVGFMPIK